MSDKEMLAGICLYIILGMVDKNEQEGKRGRKAIIKKLKKRLIEESHKSPEKYLKFIEDSEIVAQNAADEMKEKMLNPGYVVFFMHYRYPEYIKVFDISEDHIENIKGVSSEGGVNFNAMKYTNRLIKEIDKYLGE
jgi:hypothetical protein